MVSESNTNRRHFKISNTHDQIHYNNNTSKPGGICAVFAQSQRMDLTVTIGQYPLLLFSQASIWHQVILVSWLTLKLSFPHNILAMINSVSSEGNIGVILLWTSWLNIQTIYFGLYVFQSVVTVMQLAITILPSTGLLVII